MDKKLVSLVQERANGYCEVCGGVVREGALHHRKLKSRGGKDTPSNLIYIHHGCHNLKTDSIHLNPERATQNGWMVESWKEPHEAPMLMPDGTYALLLDDGTIKRLGEGNGN
jgi:5-methylcytosine-specific restriction endonuclease McrA